MARALSGIKTYSDFSAILYDSGVEGVTQVQSPYQGINHRPAWASGSGSGQANRIWYETEITLAAAASVDIDLFDFAGRDCGKGSGLDAQGLAMALDEIAFISIRHVGGTGKFRVGGNGTGAAWNSGFGGSDSAVSPDIGPGGRWELLGWTAGDLPVADSTNHLLRILGVTAEVKVDLLILGRDS